MAVKKSVEISIPLIESSVKAEGSAEELEGRTIKMDLTRMLKGKSIEAVFVCSKDLKAYPKKMTLLNFYIVRMMKKGTNYVEDSFSCKAKDADFKVKPFLLTRKKVSRGIRKALRTKAKEIITSYLQDRGADEIFSDMLSAKLQKEMSSKLKKIYPLSVCEIRVLEKKK